MSQAALYLLDTNMATYLINGRSPRARDRLKLEIESATLGISCITLAEILFGLERKPDAVRLRSAVEDLLAVMQIFAWDAAAATAYGKLRARLSASGKSLSAMDMQIAAHAIALDAILVTNDQAFRHAVNVGQLENWAPDVAIPV